MKKLEFSSKNLKIAKFGSCQRKLQKHSQKNIVFYLVCKRSNFALKNLKIAENGSQAAVAMAMSTATAT
jgi:hypothetical protein